MQAGVGQKVCLRIWRWGPNRGWSESMLARLEVGGQTGVGQKVRLRVFGGASRGWSESMVALGASRGWSESMVVRLKAQAGVGQKECACAFAGLPENKGADTSFRDHGVGEDAWATKEMNGQLRR